MRKLTFAVMIFMAGWGLGWYTHTQRANEAVQPALPAALFPSPATDSTEAGVEWIAPTLDGAGITARLLDRRDFETVVQHYESVQAQAGDAAAQDIRTQILSYAGQLITDHHFGLAEHLLQLFLVAAHRDVEARLLLASAYRGQRDLDTAIDQLYAARGHAYRPAMLQRITGRIRSVVAERVRSLKRTNDQIALLALYQHLAQLEPDHAPYFMGLAATQLALDDKEAARRSLLLVSQDPEVGAQAQAMLSQLSLAMSDTRDPASQLPSVGVVGIPLRRSGNHFIVDARPADGQSVKLLIDTGASLTILTPDVLELPGIRYENTGRSGIFSTANGQVQAPIYRLETLNVGDWQVNKLEIGVLELGGQSGIQGLLGMNFLKHFQFFIDQNEALLRLSAN